MENFEKIYDFLNTVNNLKKTMRFGAAETKNLLEESSADHSWRLSLMTFMIADELKLNINVEKALKLAIVHDIAESVCGDVDNRLIVEGRVTKEEKKKNEMEAIEKLRTMLPEERGNEIYNLFMEYETASTREGKFIKALDKIECLIHINEKGHKAIDMPDVIAPYADEAVKNFPELMEIKKAVKSKLKQEFEKGGFKWKEEYNG